MDQVEDIPEHDKIDEELLSLIHALVGTEAAEEDIDAASNILFALIEKLVESEEMDEIPETEASEEQKQEWLDEHLATLRAAFDQMMQDMASDDFDELIDLEAELAQDEEE